MSLEAAHLTIEALRSGSRSSVEQLLHHPSLEAWYRCHGGTPDWLDAVGAVLLGGESPKREGLPLDTLATLQSPRGDQARLDSLLRCADKLQDLPMNEVEARVMRLLPVGTQIRATVHVLIDGSGGYASPDGDIVLDLTQVPPSDPWAIGQWTLAHELHHVGYDSAIQANALSQRQLEPNLKLCLRAVNGLLTEGIANAYFTPSDLSTIPDVIILSEVGFDETKLSDFLSRIEADKRKMPSLLTELDQHLGLLLAGDASPATEYYVKRIKWTRPGLVRPVAHFLGEYMINAIREQFGDAVVVQCIEKQWEFLPAYQMAAERSSLSMLGAANVATLTERLVAAIER